MAQPDVEASKDHAAELERLRRENADLRQVEDQLRCEVEQLLEAQRMFEEVRDLHAERYDSAPVAWLTLSKHGEIRSANRLAAELFGVEPTRLLGVPLSTLVLPVQRRQLLDHLLSCRDAREPVNCELRLAERHGEARLVRLVTLREGGQRDGYTCAVIDLRELEETMLERDRLAVSEREARAANIAKDQFIAMLSHELRTPLTPVLAAASAFSEAEDVPADVRSAFSIVQRNVAVEVQLIDDLLDVARITNGKMHIDREPVDVHAAVHEALEPLVAECAEKQLSLLRACGAARSWVAGDARRLQQVLSNLMRNAIKFTPAGGQIEIRTWNHQQRLLIEVSDSGRGIDSDKLSRLFEPFEQVLDDSPSSLRGLGLGLAICRGIIREHGGNIIASSPGRDRGARFVIELAAIDAPPPTQTRPSTQPSLSSSTAKPRLLLVEDHEDTAEILAMLLRREGFEVKVAHCVADALAINRSEFDVLLSDVGLGEGNGLELMRTLCLGGRIDAIALSGYGTEADIRASKEAGFAEHVTKPVNFVELIDAIARLRRDSHR